VTSGLDIVNIAQQQIGFIEGPDNKNPYGDWYGLPNQPYCAMFVSWVFAQANVSALVAAETPKGFSYCPAGLAWFQKQGCVINVKDARAGDIVFYSWTNGIAQHVGIIENASPAGITVIEGNTSADHATGSQADGIGVFRRHRPYLNIMAIVRPKYPNPVRPAVNSTQNKGIAAGVAGVTALGGGGAAIMNSSTSTTPAAKTTVIAAPPFPGTSAFKVGAKGTAELIVARALANAGLLPANLVTNVLTAEELALVPIYQSKYPGLKGHQGIDAWTYTSMVAKAGS
jgi:CHAP domain